MAIKFSMQAATATPRRRAGLRVAGGIVAALAVFGLAGYFGGPPLIKSFVAKQASEALGRKVTFGGAEVHPFSLAVDVTDVTIYEPDGTTPMLTLGEAKIDGAIASLWHMAPVVDAVHIDRPSLRLARDASGRMNYADIEERFAAKPAAPKSEPARFSVNNIALTGGTVVFDDKLLKQTQRVDNLTITLPFLSNLPHDVEIVTRPTVSANVNGSAVALDGTMLPFAASRETHLNINLDGLELARYMPFAPTLQDAQIKGGLLDTRLTLGFIQQKDKQDVFLTGTAALRDADIRKHDGSPLVKAGRVAVDIARIEPLGRMVHLRSFAVDGLAVQAVRRADGSLNLAQAFLPQAAKAEKPAVAPAPVAPASSPAVAKAAPASAPAAGGVAAPAALPWRYAVDRITVKQASLGLRDELATSGPGTLALGPLDAEVTGLSGDSDKPAKVQAKLGLGEGQTLSHEGELTLHRGTMDGTLQASGVKPQAFAAWWPAELHTRLGDTALNAELHYKMAWGGPDFAFLLDKSRVELAPLYVATREPVTVPQATATTDNARRRGARRASDDSDNANLPAVSAERVALEDIAFDLGAHTFQAGQLAIAKPQIALTRDRKGQVLEAARLWAEQSGQKAVQRASTMQAKAKQPQSAAAARPVPWKAQLGKFSLDGGSLRLTDYAPSDANRDRPVIHQFRNVGLGTGPLQWPMAAGAIPLKFKAESGRRGSLAIDGTVLPTAPAAQLQVDLREFDLAPLQPYLADRFNAALRGGTATVKGRLGVDAPSGKPIAARFAGNAQFGNVRSVDRLTGDDFLRWRSLAVNGIDFVMDEAKGPMKVGVGSVALSDFYARVILNANGRLNLQDVMAGGAAKGEAAPNTSLTQANPVPAASAPAAAPAAPAAPAATVATAAAKPQIRIGGVTVEKGNINFSDFFVKPNYTANLTDMKGSVSKVSSLDPTPADLTLAGRIDDDAPVNIDGKLNPLADQLYLDIAAKAAGVELTRLTPYAAKYAGYPITKGKLTVDVAYKIENGKLDARNHLYLDQLTFGDKVDSPTATKLPVLLAVSLLKDRNGVIDINLPVAGSLSDPEFSIGGVIVRVIVNLLTKAITSPFSLIASAFGGGDELGYVEFAPGTATLTPAAAQKIATLGKALADRPALRLEISGRIDPATDNAGARRAWLDARVAEQKARELRTSARQGAVAEESEEGEQGAKVTVSPQEYPKYLETVYKRASFKKPRNMIGLSKSLPTKEMETLLLENAPVTDVELRQLAEQRALAVKQALERDAKVPESRLFLTAPKLSAEGIKDKGAPNRVDFTIRQ
ncbi:DUF748 domain-containing protein [Cupriavidus basilensis]|uniref:DUF748 domain-containing protein n=1 Tax=Cupriavidus basilensis TaxID=68895 RepID=A0ABT6AJ70_9BURK|nr:DUF748 domain-containing protein [Cupriavidus basilensis]MDF3832362.1 DUF748 domain-containing protein [Cupriavidus basilensis]